MLLTDSEQNHVRHVIDSLRHANPAFFRQLMQPIWIRVQTWLTFKTSITQDLLVVIIMRCTICVS